MPCIDLSYIIFGERKFIELILAYKHKHKHKIYKNAHNTHVYSRICRNKISNFVLPIIPHNDLPMFRLQ